VMLLITSLHTKAYLNEYCYWYPMLWVDIPSNMGEDKNYVSTMAIFELVFECTNLLSKQCHLHQYSNKYKSELRTTQYLWFCFK